MEDLKIKNSFGNWLVLEDGQHEVMLSTTGGHMMVLSPESVREIADWLEGFLRGQ